MKRRKRKNKRKGIRLYKETMKKAAAFLKGGVIAVLLYFILIGIYTRVSDDPIIFFASLVIALVVIVINGFLLWKSGLFDPFALSMVCLVYFMGLIVLTTYGPTFIDRSISYHIAFYAVDEQKVDIDEMREKFSEEIFDKRIHDAVETGFIEEGTDGYYMPTWKAKVMTGILKPIGKLTGSLHTYEELRETLTK